MFSALPTRGSTSRVSFAASLLLHCLPLLLLLIPAAPVHSAPGDKSATPLPQPPSPVNGTASSTSEQDVHLGVILWPETPEVRAIRIPPPPDPTRFNRQLAAQPQLELPFSGVYLLFQFPDPYPPPKSPVFRGALADFKFRSNDKSPLRVEARQSLPGPISLRRLGAIDVTFENIDLYFSAIALEIFFLDTRQKPPTRLSLGSQPLTGGPNDGHSEEHTLHYPIPGRATGEADEILLRFHLAAFRADTAPRVRLKRFRFLPR